jgi:hypothetical protein
MLYTYATDVSLLKNEETLMIDVTRKCYSQCSESLILADGITLTVLFMIEVHHAALLYA